MNDTYTVKEQKRKGKWCHIAKVLIKVDLLAMGVMHNTTLPFSIETPVTVLFLMTQPHRQD